MANSFNSTVTGPNIENPARLFQLNSTNTQNGDIKSTKSEGAYTLNVGSTGILSMENALVAASASSGDVLASIPALPADASTKTYILQAINGTLTWTAVT